MASRDDETSDRADGRIEGDVAAEPDARIETPDDVAVDPRVAGYDDEGAADDSSTWLGGMQGSRAGSATEDDGESGLSVSAAELFRAMRAVGLRPHPFGEPLDGKVGSWLERGVQREIPASPSGPAPPDALILSSVTLDPRFGINSLHMEEEEDEDEDEDEGGFTEMETYGWWFHVVSDVMRLGVGHLRHMKQMDLKWVSIFPDPDVEDEGDDGEKQHAEVIPAPAEIYARMTAESSQWGPFAAIQASFGPLLTTCCLSGLQVVPTVFTYGGSANYIDSLAEVEAVKRIDTNAYVPSLDGWSSFYYDLDGRSGSQEEEAYLRYVLNVLAADGASSYLKEGARRKALAIAAFSQALGEYFRLWAKALQMVGRSLVDYVPYVECGNELSSVNYSPEEAGTLMALMAGPIRMCVPELRFRAAELASPPNDVEWSSRVDWLQLAISGGFEEEVARWSAPGSRWQRTCEAAGFYWPPELVDGGSTWPTPSDPTELMHQVGFHFYHQNENEGVGYLGEYWLEVVSLLIRGCIERLAERGYALTWSMSETGFQAENSDDEETDELPYHEESSPLFQAGILVRRLLVAHALGAERVAWHDYQSNIKPSASGVFGAHGIRNDVETADEDGPGFQAELAYRRPSWFAYRRLVWLVSLADEVEILRNDGSVTVLRLTSATGFYPPSDDEAAGSPVPARRGYRYAYLAWMDKYSTTDAEDSWDMELWDWNAAGYELVSMAPDVVAPVVASVDENGFAAGESVDWSWSGWDWCQASRGERLAFEPLTGILTGAKVPTLTFTLRPLGTTLGRPVPTCILTDAAWSESYPTDLTLEWLERNAKFEEWQSIDELRAGLTRYLLDEAARSSHEIRDMLDTFVDDRVPWPARSEPWGDRHAEMSSRSAALREMDRLMEKVATIREVLRRRI